jgi:hypothetical protein
VTREEFSAAVRKMVDTKLGVVAVKDFYPTDGRAPYRYAEVMALAAFEDSPEIAGRAVKLAIEIDGHVSIMTHYTMPDGLRRACAIAVAFSRVLDEGERRVLSAPPIQAFQVALSDVVGDEVEAFEARLEGDPFVWGRGATEREAILDAKEILQDSGSKDIEGDIGSARRHGGAVVIVARKPTAADFVLTRSCPSLTPGLRAELLEDLQITPREAARINALIRAWGETSNTRNGVRMTAGDRAHDLRERILANLAETRVAPAALEVC